MAYLLASADQITTGRMTYGRCQAARAFVLVENSANTAGVYLYVSPNPQDHFLALTGWALTPGQTATAQVLDMYFPYVQARIDWVSGGAVLVNALYDEMGRGH